MHSAAGPLFWSSHLSVIRLFSFALVAALGSHGAVAQVIDKPEVKDLVPRVKGYLIWTKEVRELMATELPAMKERVVHPIRAEVPDHDPIFHAISGPDNKGRIAYVEDHLFVPNKKDEKHLLKTIQIDGKNDTEVFSRPGNALWAGSAAGRGEIGKHVALASTGGKAAILCGLSGKQMPRAYLHEGNIEIWDVEKKVKLPPTAKALDKPMSWFPDGKRLAYVTMVSRDVLPKETLGLAEFGEYFDQKWDEVPAIFVLDIESGKTSFLHIGWTPVVACDGKSVLVGGWGRTGFSWNSLEIESRKSSPVHWPGDAGGAIAMPAENIVLYLGLPTAGAPIKYADDDKERPLDTVKVALLNSDKFQTVAPAIDSRFPVSFGQVLKRD